MNLDEKAINRRVLIVDDNAGIHEDFRRILGTSPAADDAMGAPSSVDWEVELQLGADIVLRLRRSC